ncbi:hypothetical protein DICVIV_09167 [Dictyocaulus viviparus]|uniref:Uncharacterized protein n=1 Tax=Dictyocaulus viviparus TaxID=29172 RepID=A0A0D8XJM8_DICVI|nr:hypothetical protein DICVIV_09167 [Dictyocaulus viviparus]
MDINAGDCTDRLHYALNLLTFVTTKNYVIQKSIEQWKKLEKYEANKCLHTFLVSSISKIPSEKSEEQSISFTIRNRTLITICALLHH